MGRTLKTAIRAVPTALLSLALAVAVLWHSVAFSILIVLSLLATLLPAKDRPNRLRQIVVISLAAIIFVSCIIAYDWKAPIQEIISRMTELHWKAFDNPANLTITDKMAVWSANLIMGIAGYPLFPEVAWETLRLVVPGPESHVRQSDFAMRSRKVRKAIAAFANQLPPVESKPKHKTIKISWNRYTDVPYGEVRVGLALNCPLVLDLESAWKNNGWLIKARASCDVAYPRFRQMTEVPLFSGLSFPISETMFWALQEEGWLFPYNVSYEWTVGPNVEKPRLKDVDKILILKDERKMYLLKDNHILRTFEISLGTNPVGPKTCQGDRKTPEGEYRVAYKNPHSAAHLSLMLSYPNAIDRQNAKANGCNPGGNIAIHGFWNEWDEDLEPLYQKHDWTLGCIAVSNDAIEEIYEAVPVGTLVEIRP